MFYSGHQTTELSPQYEVLYYRTSYCGLTELPCILRSKENDSRWRRWRWSLIHTPGIYSFKWSVIYDIPWVDKIIEGRLFGRVTFLNDVGDWIHFGTHLPLDRLTTLCPRRPHRPTHILDANIYEANISTFLLYTSTAGLPVVMLANEDDAIVNRLPAVYYWWLADRS